LALEAEGSFILAVQPGEHIEKRSLARAVRADEPVDRALRNSEAHVRQRGQAAEALRNARNLKYWRSHALVSSEFGGSR